MTEYIDVAAARAFVEANYQGDPLLRHLYGTLLDKLPKVEAVPVSNRNITIANHQPIGLMGFAYACPRCRNIGTDLCEKCKMEVEGGFYPKEE
jgi:hypothetical protein